MKIKQLTSESLAEIVSFDALCFPADHWKETEWAEILADPRAIYYAITDGSSILGSIFLYNWQGQRDYVKIMTLAVHPDHRRRGIAHRLLHDTAAEMAKTDMTQFRAETRASNIPMQRVFESCGYSLSDTEENYYDNPTESAYKYILQR